MNLLAQNPPRQFIPGRVVAKLTDEAPAKASRFQVWYADNRAEVITNVRNHYAKNRDAINAKRRAQYAADPEKYRAEAAAKYRRHAEKIKARVAARAQRLKGI